jgi:hypothetical protein
MLRGGLASRRATAQRQQFKIVARDLGDLKPGLSLDRLGTRWASRRPAATVILIDAIASLSGALRT